MKKLISHLKKYILRGLLAIIPLALSLLAVKLLYTAIDQRVMGLLEKHIGFSFPGLGLLLVLAFLYLLGLVATNVVGRQVLKVVDKLTAHIPLVGTTHKIGKQLASTLALPERQAFKRAVLVNYLKTGTWTIGFVTGSVVDRKQNDEVLLKVFVPTPPNPLSGTMIIVPESETRDPGWSVEEALKMVISGGILGPPEVS